MSPESFEKSVGFTDESMTIAGPRSMGERAIPMLSCLIDRVRPVMRLIFGFLQSIAPPQVVHVVLATFKITVRIASNCFGLRSNSMGCSTSARIPQAFSVNSKVVAFWKVDVVIFESKDCDLNDRPSARSLASPFRLSPSIMMTPERRTRSAIGVEVTEMK
jgi:hypothetical protein